MTAASTDSGPVTSVEAAVLAAYPGATIERLETDADGATYEAHITLADGSEATVKPDEAFAGHCHRDARRLNVPPDWTPWTSSLASRCRFPVVY